MYSYVYCEQLFSKYTVYGWLAYMTTSKHDDDTFLQRFFISHDHIKYNARNNIFNTKIIFYTIVFFFSRIFGDGAYTRHGFNVLLL